MKNILAATLALSLVAGQVTAQEAKMDRETIVVSTMEGARDDNWVGVALTVIVFFLIFGGSSSGGVGNASDERLKTDIKTVGATPDGLPLYHFRYIGQSTVYQGVMAQDVLSYRPEAVSVGAFGYMLVNYDMLGLTMQVVD